MWNAKILATLISALKNLICIWETHVISKGPGPFSIKVMCKDHAKATSIVYSNVDTEFLVWW